MKENRSLQELTRWLGARCWLQTFSLRLLQVLNPSSSWAQVWTEKRRLPRQSSAPSTRTELPLVAGLFPYGLSWVFAAQALCHLACIPLENLFWDKHSVTVLAGLELILEPVRSWMSNHPASASQEARSADLHASRPGSHWGFWATWIGGLSQGPWLELQHMWILRLLSGLTHTCLRCAHLAKTVVPAWVVASTGYSGRTGHHFTLGLPEKRDSFHMKKTFGEFDKSKPGSAAS